MNSLITLQSGEQRLSLADLIQHYQTDPDSSFHALRYHVRENHRGLHRRIAQAYGHLPLSQVDTRELKQWHRQFLERGKIASGHAYIAELRTMINHGFLLLDGADRIECFRLSQVLSKLKFPQPAPREVFMTAQHATDLRIMAHEFGWHSLALAQALQFELLLRQKDVVGEWVPAAEPGRSNVEVNGNKWLRGLRWSEIDENLILRHVTSKRLKKIEVDLKLAPMVMEELAMIDRRTEGPVIICEVTGAPYSTAEFRRKWRIVANAAGIPKTINNMDSRSGGITEASNAGIEIEHIRHAATHSSIAMTQRYSRGATEKIAGVQAKRAAFRNKTAPKEQKAGTDEYEFLVSLKDHQGDDCVIWPFAAGENGRSLFFHNGQSHWAHRLMCQMVHGPASDDRPLAAHECGNGDQGCVNPRHLNWKSHSENQLDRTRHGTASTGAKLNFTPEQIEDIRAKYGIYTQTELAAMYGCSLGAIQYYLKYREQRGHEPSPAAPQRSN
jgi:hypothetical protein